MEGSRITCGLWLFVFLAGCGRLSGFNLDTDNVQKKTGDPGSLFGFSLAMHWQTQPVNKKMLLVGAPRSASLPGQTSTVTGGLYKCDMSTNSPDCERVIFDNSEDRSRESKDNQWMGVSVSSQGPGGKIVTCAHRYQRRANVGTRIETRDIIGRCVVMGEDLTIKAFTDEEGDNWHFCESRPRGHELFGSCQQGLSATFDKQYRYLIFGAPGAYNWKGIVRLEQKNETLLLMGVYDDGPYEVGDENEKDPDKVPAPVNSYLGFSLDSGSSLTTQGQLTVVAGAPRANYSGAVVLLKKVEYTNNMEEEFILEGEGLASSFGYDLTVLDLNKDRWQDIVVGAPQYFEKDGQIGGAVYVFINKGGKWKTVKPIRIDGPQNSMFGLAVKNLGDIDQDGYNDFAVGAPYDDDGAGKVYIFHGSKTGLKSLEAVQTLSGQSVNAKLFGYSLAGNMDLDGNSYPDLAIGTLSDAVFVYKARPVISIKKEIKFTPEKIDFTKKNCDPNFCLEVKACFTYTANPKSVSTKMTVAYSMQADADLRAKKLNSRAYFTGPSGNSFEANGVITIVGQGKEECVKQTLVIQEDIKDKLNGIPVDVSVKLQESKRKRRQTASPAPVLDATEHATTRSEVNFLQGGCGGDSICRSNLQMSYRYGHMPKAGGPFEPLPTEGGLAVISTSKHKQIILEVQVTNLEGDDAHEASVIASFPRSLSYANYDSLANGPQVVCTANRNGSIVDCELGNPFRRDSRATFYIYLDTSSISFEHTEVDIDLKLETTSEQKKIAPVKAKAKVNIALQLSLSGIAQPSQVYLAKKGKGETATKAEKNIGSAVIYQFRISNPVKHLSGFGTATLKILWPKDTSTGKGLLYLMKISSAGGNQIKCSPEGAVNPLNKVPSSRTRRGTDDAQWEGTISRLVDNKKQKTLSCNNGAKCVEILCPLKNLGSNEIITLNSHLWDNTFTEEFSKFSPVEVVVETSLQFNSTAKNIGMEKAETQVKMKVYHDRRAEAVSSGVPWWIIFLSILFGLLLLGLLAFIIWKCGFFKRANYEEKVPSYNAIRIKREEREITSGIGTWESPDKKSWMTNG